MNVFTVLFDDFETMDAFGPAEVFGKNPEHFHLHYVSVSGDVINSAQGVKVWTDFLVPKEMDGILVLPGGKGARRLLWKDQRALNLIRKAAENVEFCLMVGNGSSLLAQTGMLYRRKAADFPMDENWKRMFEAGVDRVKERLVVDGKFYSCSDTASGVDLALWLTADVLDIEFSEKAAKSMGYDWDSEGQDIYN